VCNYFVAHVITLGKLALQTQLVTGGSDGSLVFWNLDSGVSTVKDGGPKLALNKVRRASTPCFASTVRCDSKPVSRCKTLFWFQTRMYGHAPRLRILSHFCLTLRKNETKSVSSRNVLCRRGRSACRRARLTKSSGNFAYANRQTLTESTHVHFC
jgi:hypothetical protein